MSPNYASPELQKNIYTLFPSDLIYSLSFNYHLYADNVHACIYSPDFSLFHDLKHSFNYLADISASMIKGPLKLNQLKTKFVISSLKNMFFLRFIHPLNKNTLSTYYVPVPPPRKTISILSPFCPHIQSPSHFYSTVSILSTLSFVPCTAHLFTCIIKSPATTHSPVMLYTE